jgi:hypothetical protein
MSERLDGGQKHLLRLVAQGVGVDGWTPVSAPVFPLMEKVPQALIELERVGDEGRGRVRLTVEGQGIIDAMAWL